MDRLKSYGEQIGRTVVQNGYWTPCFYVERLCGVKCVGSVETVMVECCSDGKISCRCEYGNPVCAVYSLIHLDNVLDDVTSAELRRMGVDMFMEIIGDMPKAEKLVNGLSYPSSEKALFHKCLKKTAINFHYPDYDFNTYGRIRMEAAPRCAHTGNGGEYSTACGHTYILPPGIMSSSAGFRKYCTFCGKELYEAHDVG